MTGTEDQLRTALDLLADGVQPAPDAYRQVQRQWRRRERRRRLILYILVIIVFACADLLGLWALNNMNNPSHVIFNPPATTRTMAP